MFNETLFSTAVLIHLGALLYVIGFLVRDELALRLLVLGGTILYILYYLLFPDVPLWDAILTSSILGIANVWILCKIVFERYTFAMSDDEKKLYEVFSTLTPGQFRLYYLIEGNARIEKGDSKFEIPSDKFLGEISFILESNYSATVLATKDMRYVEWNTEELRSLMKKNPLLRNALIALFNQDLAKKLAVSHQ